MRISKKFCDAIRLMHDGDLLLLESPGLIATAGRGRYSHAAKVARWGKDLFLLEVVQGHGGRAITLESQVKKHPGQYDVYGVDVDAFPAYNRMAATDYMKQLCGCDYGWLNIAFAALWHLPLVRHFVRVPRNDEAPILPPFCSQACAMADRIGGGVDPVPQLADRLTEPCDLARSNLYKYKFTLIP